MAIRQIYTLSQITNRLINRMTSVSSITDYTPGSNIRSIFESIAAFVEYMQFLVEEVYRSFYIDTASLDDLDARVRDFGMSRKQAKNATGIIKFMKNDPATSTFTISEGSQVSTEPDVFGNTISYTLDKDIFFVSGSVEVTGEITCAISGPEGNVASGKITNITSAIPGVDAIINPSALTDGASAETDEQLRRRVPIYINGLKRGNEDAIKSAILAIDGITLVKLEENNPLDGYITIYVSNESGQLTQDQIDAVRITAENAASFGIQVSVVTPSVIYVTIELDAEIDDVNYDEDIVKASMRSSIDEYIRINPESSVQLYRIILAGTIPGVENIKNVKINGIEDDYLSQQNFVVIRLNDKDLDITINKVN